MVYTVQSDFESGREFYSDSRAGWLNLAATHELKVMPGVYTIVGRCEQEPDDIHGALRDDR